MAFFNGWPWAQFQEQNLDWIVNELKKHSGSIKELQAFVDDMAGEIKIDVSGIMDAWLEDGTIAELLDPKIADRAYMGDSLKDFAEAHPDIENYSIVCTAGYNSAFDGGGGVYIVNSSAGLLKNGKYYYPLYVRHALGLGIVADGATDNSDQLSLALGFTREISFYNTAQVLLSKPVTIPSGRKIHGNGCSFIVANANSFANGQAMLTGSGLYDIEIDGIKFNRETGTKHFYAISILSSNNVKIHDCSFENGKGYMIRLNSNTNGVVRDITAANIEGVSGDPGGVIYQQGGHDMLFENIVARDITDHVLYLDGATELYGVAAVNISCWDNKSTDLTNAAVIAVYGTVHDFIIRGMKCANVKTGIVVMSRNDHFPTFGIIQGCEMRDIEEDGITLHNDASESVKLANIIVSDNLLQSCGQDAISVRYVNQACIQDNYIRSTTRYAIEISGGSAHSITGNKILSAVEGVLIGNAANTSACKVFGNIITNASTPVNVSSGSTENRISRNIESGGGNSSIASGNYTDLISWVTT